jgi:hypothetical protein
MSCSSRSPMADRDSDTAKAERPSGEDNGSTLSGNTC